jgi:hypothetical protein
MKTITTAILWIALIATAIHFSNYCPDIEPLLKATLP